MTSEQHRSDGEKSSFFFKDFSLILCYFEVIRRGGVPVLHALDSLSCIYTTLEIFHPSSLSPFEYHEQYVKLGVLVLQ